MTIEQFRIGAYVQTALALTIAVMAFWNFRSRTMVIRLVGFCGLIGVLGNSLGFLFTYLRMRSLINLPQSLYFILVFCLISMIYYHALKKQGKAVFILVVGVFLVFAFSNLLFIQKDFINSYNNVFSAVLVTGYAIYYFHRLMVDLPTIHLNRFPMFWINTGFLLYHAGAFFLFVFTDFLVHVLGNNLLYYWTFHNILSNLSFLIIITGLWIDLQNTRLPS
jgi:hypothetical protein